MSTLLDELYSQTKSIKLTPDILRRFPNCEHYTNEQAVGVIASLEKLAEICYKIEINSSKGS